MPLTDFNKTDGNDNAIVTIGNSTNTSSADLGTTSGSKIALYTINDSVITLNSGFVFGDAVVATTTITAIRRTAYTEQSTNAQRSILSASASDSSAGIGARTVQITYFDQTGAGPFTETVTLNGVSSVNTSNTNICFIEKMVVLTVGSSLTNVGIITLKAATAGGGATIGTIAATDNQTYWCHHYVAINKTCAISNMDAAGTGTTNTAQSTFVIKQYSIPTANAAEIIISPLLRWAGNNSTAESILPGTIKITGPARLTLYVLADANASQTFRCSFNYSEN